MRSAPLPRDELGRLNTRRSLDILDTSTREVFNSFVRVAAALFHAPMAAISLFEEDRQRFKTLVGQPISEVCQEGSFCAHAILRPGEVLCVPDVRLDARFHDNLDALSKGAIRFYAGAPLLTEEGEALGTLCVADQTPRLADAWQLAQLCDLAKGVSAAIRLHGALRRVELDSRSDPLTNLGNRREFEAMLMPLASEGVALFLLDLDGFKGINDVFGHPGGDLALQEVGRRLQAAVRSRDRVFRLGGDEFALICPGMSAVEDRHALANRIHGAMADTFMIDGQAVPLRTSIGCAGLPEHATSPQELVHLADVALYDAKRAGRGVTRHVGPSPAPEPSGAIPEAPARPRPHRIGRIDLADRLRRALVPGGAEPFTLAFQPVVALSTQRVSSLEALVRWNVGPDSFVPPSEFVTLAERLGLISHLDRWVLTAACRAAARWPNPWLVSINVSAVSFGLIDVAAMVEDALTVSGLPAARLVIEMTEAALAGDAAQARKVVQGIRALGARVSLDDFGAGHSSLTTLRQLPCTGIKISRSLVAEIGTDPVHAHMVRLIAEFGHALDVRVVAEGLETIDQLIVAAQCGVSLVQGHLLAKPAAAEDVVRSVREAEGNVRAALANGDPRSPKALPGAREGETAVSGPTEQRAAPTDNGLVPCPPLRTFPGV